MIKRSLFAALPFLGIALASQGAPISWESATDVSAESDVSLIGTLVEAVNAAATSVTSSPTVNGVEFVSDDSLLSGDTATDLFNGSISTGYDQLLSNADFGGGTLATVNIGGGNLEIGMRYEVQVWFSDTRGVRTMNFTDGETPANVVSVGGGQAQYAIGIFTANGSSQTLQLIPQGFNNAHVTAYQLRELPQLIVSTTGLLDLSGRDTSGLGNGESNSFTPAPKTFGPATDFSLNNIQWSDRNLSGTFDLSFDVTSSSVGIRRGGKGGWGTAADGSGSALIDSGQSVTLSNVSLSDFTGDLVGQNISDVELIAIYLGNGSNTDGATINGAAASGDSGGDTTESMRNSIDPSESAIVLGTGGDGFSLNGIDVTFNVGLPITPIPTLTTVTDSVSAPFTVQVSFTEPVINLSESDFIVSGGMISPSSLSGSGDTWQVEVTPTANGVVGVNLPADVVDDIDGDNAQNIASQTLEVFHLAPGADQPSAALTSASPTANAAFVVDVVFDEAVSGLEIDDFEVSNATLSDFSGSGAVYSVLASPIGVGEVTISLPAGVATDLDGDLLDNLASSTLSVDFDFPDAPVPTIYGNLSSPNPSYKIHLSFTEEVAGLGAGDFQISNGNVSGVGGSGKYWSATVTATTPGTVEITLPAGVVTDTDGDDSTNVASNTLVTDCLSDFGERWLIDEAAEWTAATGNLSNLSLTQAGHIEPTADSSEFSSSQRTFPTKRKAKSVVFTQSLAWENWTQIPNVQPDGAGDAPILVPVGPDNYYLLARDGSAGYYAAWHSDDMENWDYRGQVTPPTTGRWVTTAEYKDGEFYIYSDYFNDHTPRLFIDDNLDDGIPGVDMGSVLVKNASGSDNSVIRNDEDGLFHMIYEDWSPINASTHSWDSPLAGHTSSSDGINGFVENEHAQAVDNRTTPTGTIGTYSHPNVPNETYEIHTPEQDAYGDWTTVKIGSRFFLFGDFDPHGEGIKLARFASESIYEQFEITGSMHAGHPDPTVGFAEGQFYLITQQDADYVSPGPWVEGVEARAGVDTDGNGEIDEWTDWQTISEQYDYTPNYIRVVDLTPAQVDMSALPAGYGFQFEFKVDDTVVSNASPVMDRVEMSFEPSNFQTWSNDLNIPAVANQDHDTDNIPNLIEFAMGQDSLPLRLEDGTLVLTATSEALEDGYQLELEFSEDLESWTTATTESEGTTLLSAMTTAGGDEEMTFQVLAPNEGSRLFWRLVVRQN